MTMGIFISRRTAPTVEYSYACMLATWQATLHSPSHRSTCQISEDTYWNREFYYYFYIFVLFYLPPRTFSNHFSAEKERCVEVFDVSLEWFDCTEPHLHSGRTRCVGYLYTVSEWFPQRTSSNLLEPLQCRVSKVCRSL